jgi:hypothetical protein
VTTTSQAAQSRADSPGSAPVSLQNSSSRSGVRHHATTRSSPDSASRMHAT